MVASHRIYTANKTQHYTNDDMNVECKRTIQPVLMRKFIFESDKKAIKMDKKCWKPTNYGQFLSDCLQTI